ncbi:hypothetical protein BN126_1035 [Cronobacter sakazakii 680]|nr:hypothetical protein BN126_1035 [Cronobacter sakazakii 680]
MLLSNIILHWLPLVKRLTVTPLASTWPQRVMLTRSRGEHMRSFSRQIVILQTT